MPAPTDDLRILVADKLAPEGLALLDDEGIAYDVKIGLSEERFGRRGYGITTAWPSAAGRR